MKTSIIRTKKKKLLLAKAQHGEEETHSVKEAQRGAKRGVAAKYPKLFHHPDMLLRCSQLITGNPYSTKPSLYPHHHTINSLAAS